MTTKLLSNQSEYPNQTDDEAEEERVFYVQKFETNCYRQDQKVDLWPLPSDYAEKSHVWQVVLFFKQIALRLEGGGVSTRQLQLLACKLCYEDNEIISN